jgi:hypothetical protein
MDTPNPDSLKRIVAHGLTSECLDALDQLFPERTPELGETLDQIRYASGQRSVVRFLKAITNERNGPQPYD